MFDRSPKMELDGLSYGDKFRQRKRVRIFLRFDQRRSGKRKLGGWFDFIYKVVVRWVLPTVDEVVGVAKSGENRKWKQFCRRRHECRV